MTEYPQFVYKKHTFLSALVVGLSALAIAFVISCTVVIIYGMHFAGEKSDKIVALMENAVRGLPKLQESLPPALADLLDDRRQPDYATQLEISTDTKLLPDQNGMVRTTIEVVNNGKEVVSMLSLRVVVLNAQNEIITESNEWAATPFAANHQWRGPLMPGSHRYFHTSQSGLPVFSLDELKTEVEITDIRIWNGDGKISLTGEEALSEADQPDSQPADPKE